MNNEANIFMLKAKNIRSLLLQKADNENKEMHKNLKNFRINSYPLEYYSKKYLRRTKCLNTNSPSPSPKVELLGNQNKKRIISSNNIMKSSKFKQAIKPYCQNSNSTTMLNKMDLILSIDDKEELHFEDDNEDQLIIEDNSESFTNYSFSKTLENYNNILKESEDSLDSFSLELITTPKEENKEDFVKSIKKFLKHKKKPNLEIVEESHKYLKDLLKTFKKPKPKHRATIAIPSLNTANILENSNPIKNYVHTPKSKFHPKPIKLNFKDIANADSRNILEDAFFPFNDNICKTCPNEPPKTHRNFHVSMKEKTPIEKQTNKKLSKISKLSSFGKEALNKESLNKDLPKRKKTCHVNFKLKDKFISETKDNLLNSNKEYKSTVECKNLWTEN